MTIQQTKPGSAAQQRAQTAFRARNRRIDYYPGDAAIKAIERLGVAHPDANLRQLIDYLVEAGDAAIRKVPQR